MSESPQLTPEQAQAALEEAGVRAGQVRRNDRQLAWMLLVLAAAFLAVAALFSFESREGRSFAGPAVLLMLAAALIAVVVIGLRIRAYSRGGIKWFFSAAIAFSLWNAAVSAVSSITRFWAPNQPNYHFAISVVVAVIPLVVGGFALARRG
jgi:lysylphosphatidylglycerol synthetase-like protein (DUF2156 family)